MKSFVSVNIQRVVFLLVVVCVFGTAALGQPWAGSGDVNNPYQIWDTNDMQAIGADANYWDAHFNLMADINLAEYTGTEFNIIGNYSNHFTGVFDGKGHTISGFTYNSNGVDCIGLFGYVDEPNAQVRNLWLADPNINAGSGICVGALVGVLAEGNVFMCGVDEGNVKGGDYVGGLVGGNGNLGENKEGTISDCYASVMVSGRNKVGGLVGGSVGTVAACYAAGVVDGNEEVGGLVGKNWTGTIFESYSSADVSGSFRVGGLVGNNGYEPQLHGSGSVSNSYALGSVVGTDQVGGLAGINDGGIYYCYSAGGVSGNTDVGGLVGVNQDAYVIDSFWDWQSSGQVSSSGGTGKTTAEMQTESTFTDAGWDFVGETINGPNDVWTICEGEDYPRLAWEKYGGGNGTEANPYLIRTSCQMNAIGADSNDWDKHFKLMADIDLSGYTGTSFNIIGTFVNPFTGVFDGKGHTISGFTYNSNGVDCIGIFGAVGWGGIGGEIRDLGLIDPNIDAGTGGSAGPLAGRIAEAYVMRCYSEGGSVSGQYLIGGLVGENHLGEVSNCRSAVSVSGSDWVGGLVGRNYGGTISDSNSASTVDGSAYIGGLVGNSVFIFTHDFIYPEVYNCCATGDVNGDSYVGGLVGYAEDGNISSSYAIGSVTGNVRTGGLVGENEGTILECYATASVTGHYQRTGGLVGRNKGGRISNSHARGSVTGDDWETGGLAGENWNGTISNCYSIGNVAGHDGTGGLVGVNREVGTILNCYAAGSISGQYETGGFVGIHQSGSYTKCFWDSEVNPDVNGIGNTTDPNVIGESTANMQTESTFTDAGWDFVGEVINGANDIWLICNEGYNYPRLWWEQPRVYHVDIINGNDNNNGLTAATAFATIQAGIDVACNEEMLQVRPGVYNESLFFINKGITVQGTDGAAVIEASGVYAVSFYTSEGPNSVLKNFVIRDSDTGIFVSSGSPTLEHLTIVDCNLGIEAEAGAGPNIRNCIFWNNSFGDLFQCQAQYSCIEGGDEGMGNISLDPLFVDPNGDYHLKSEGWRWTEELVHGSHWYYDSETSRCIDAGNPGSPLGEELMSVPEDPNNVWGVNVRVNMGAYGGTTQASLAPHDWALLADLNNDGVVNFVDFTGQASEWQMNGGEWHGDLNRDGVVNVLDFVILAEDWLEALPWAGN